MPVLNVGAVVEPDEPLTSAVAAAELAYHNIVPVPAFTRVATEVTTPLAALHSE